MKHLTLTELQEWQALGRDFELIDVREWSEHEAFNIGGACVPLSEAVRAKGRFLTQKPIVFYCKRGVRSQIAIQRLKTQFPDAVFYNLQGGIFELLPDALKK
jgi:rhodanese-related sulfurtransferase